MGSPVSPLLANVWMSEFDKRYLETYKPILYSRYMDDILTIVKRSGINRRYDAVNEWHSSLKFTFEVEDPDGKLPFLDMMLINDKDKDFITSTWYRKPSNSGLTLNYYALAPTKYKRSVVHSFIHRVWNSCSTWKHFARSMKDMKETLEDNQYPPFFL